MFFNIYFLINFILVKILLFSHEHFMKNLIRLSILLFYSSLYAQNTDLTKEKLNGKIKHITTIDSKLIDPYKTIVKYNELGNKIEILYFEKKNNKLKESGKESYKYDNKNRLIEYNSSNEHFKEIYKYDENDSLLEKTSFVKNNKPLYKYLFEYDKNKIIKTFFTNYEYGTTVKCEYLYENNKLIEKDYITSNGKTISKESYEYNKNFLNSYVLYDSLGNITSKYDYNYPKDDIKIVEEYRNIDSLEIISTTTYDNNFIIEIQGHKINSHFKYSYDDKANTVLTESFTNGILEEKIIIEYIYDDNKNWIKESITSSIQNSPFNKSFVNRVIEYY